MNIYKKIKFIKKFSYFLVSKNKQLESEITNANLRKVSVHIFKSDFVILFFTNIVIYTLAFMELIFKKYSNFFFSIIFFPLDLKFKELLISAILINNSKFFEKHSSKNMYVSNDYYDYIVLGSGPSGSINSYYLNEKFPGQVLLLEKGKDVSTFKKKHPQDEFIKKWKNGGFNSTLFPMQIPFASGECFGGGSEINSGLFHKPSKKFLEKWSSNLNFISPNKNEIDNHYGEIEKVLENNKILPDSNSYKYFTKGCENLNISYEHIPQFYSKNNKDTESYKKNTMRSTFIKKFLQNRGHAQTGFDAKFLKYSKQKDIWEISGKLNGKNKIFRCRNLFLNCGALQSSKILMKSKLYSEEVSTFKFHPMVKMIVEFDKQIQQGYENVHPFQFTDLDEEYIAGEASSGGQFIKMNFLNNLNLFDYVKKTWKNMSIYHCTFSIGKGNIIKIPLINKFIYTYSIKNKDMSLIKKALKETSKTLFSGGAKRIFLITSKGALEIKSDNYISKISELKKPNSLKFSSVHILGGIKSGESNNCVVDSYGKSTKYRNLYINDSSLINENLLRNPQGTVMLIAKRNIENFIKNFKDD